MKIQSLSVVVPTNKCINQCKFCCACMVQEDYKNQMDENLPFYDLYQKDYLNRLEFARDNGCNTVMLTGNGEPQQNRNFLQQFGTLNSMLEKPFRNIEIQTTGVLLDENYLRFLRNHVRVSTISLSISSLNDEMNFKYNGTHEKHMVGIEDLCEKIKKYDFNLRLSINLTDEFNQLIYTDSIIDFFKFCKERLGADQIIFRKLYISNNDSEQDNWIKEHKINNHAYSGLISYIKNEGVQIGILETGAIKYSINDMSIVLDDDCMSETLKESYKYLILRPNCKLYSLWNNRASLIF